jgi:hypothetical protein
MPMIFIMNLKQDQCMASWSKSNDSLMSFFLVDHTTPSWLGKRGSAIMAIGNEKSGLRTEPLEFGLKKPKKPKIWDI